MQTWGPPQQPAGPPQGGALNIGRYVSAIRRYKWLIAVIVLLGTIGGIVATRFAKAM